MLPDRYPEAGEICGVATRKLWKSSALLFDRILVGPEFDLATDPGLPLDLTFGFSAGHELYRQEEKPAIVKSLDPSLVSRLGSQDAIDNLAVEIVNRSFVNAYRKMNIESVPVFGDRAPYLKSVDKGPVIAYQAALMNIPTVVDEAASWGQVGEFRSDSESTRKYRALRHWLLAGLQADSVEEARDTIALKIEDYNWALRKHGFETIIGSIEFLLDWKKIGQAAGIGGSVALLGGSDTFASLLAGLAIAGPTAAALSKRLIDLKDLKRSSEVAILKEIRDQFV